MNRYLLLIFLCLACGCNTTEQAEEVTYKSGFLDNYSQLTKGEEGQALLGYRKNNVDWSQYKKIMIDPIQFWVKDDSDLKKIDRVKVEKILGFLNSTLIQGLRGNFEIVKKPGPGVLHLRMALTEGESSRMIVDTVSTVVPVTFAISYLSKWASGNHIAVGKATAEVEILDSVSGARLVAAIDSRYGGKGLKGKFDSWDDVKSSFEYWVSRINSKLGKLQK
ncbi:MAG: DUF3313 domain-containing protein [Lentisphaeraceae bacterium]|nr:DUF3313 domain-containing protein [Lentisphaeraceae bacterium]